MDMLIDAYTRYQAVFGADVEYIVEEYPTQEQAEARATELGGSGSHSHEQEDGTVVYMPFATHEEYELVMEMKTGSDAEEGNFKEDLRDKIKDRLNQLIEGTYSQNSL
jgi:hypothetical protein